MRQSSDVSSLLQLAVLPVASRACQTFSCVCHNCNDYLVALRFKEICCLEGRPPLLQDIIKTGEKVFQMRSHLLTTLPSMANLAIALPSAFR
jgi:hypothetical protein